MLWQMTGKATRFVAAGFGILFFLLATIGGSLVHFCFGDQFSGLGWVVAALCMGMYLHVVGSPVEAALSALKDGRALLYASLVRLALILLVGIPLIAWYGPVGVGLAMSCSALSACVLQWQLLRVRVCHAS